MKKLLIILLIFWIPLQAYSADYTGYIANGNEYIKVDIYNCGSYCVYMQTDTEKQLITYDALKDAFESIPLKLKEGIQCLVVVDFESPRERKEIDIFSEYYKNNIFYYRNDNFSIRSILYIDESGKTKYYIIKFKDALVKYTYHEVAHHYDSLNNISSTEEWHKAVDVSKVRLSALIELNYAEEFAESVDRYYLDPDFLKKKCPERYKFMNKLLE
jgi:hypothetical protein